MALIVVAVAVAGSRITATDRITDPGRLAHLGLAALTRYAWTGAAKPAGSPPSTWPDQAPGGRVGDRDERPLRRGTQAPPG